MNTFNRAVLAGTTAGFFLIAAANARLQTSPVPQDPQTAPRPDRPQATPPPDAMPMPAPTPMPMPTPEPTPSPEQPAPTDPSAPTPPAESDAASAVTAATDQWLALVDTGKFGESWTAAGQLFQANVTQDQWAANMTTGRTPLGEVVKRELAERKAMDQVAGAPAGEYVVAAYFTDYAARAGLLETVTLVKENDTWKVIGYNIAPKPAGQGEAPATPPADTPPAETPPPPPGR